MADLISPKVAKTIRILHVDDDSSLREISKLMLLDIDHNFEVDQASGVDEGLSKLSSGQYDVVVSDYDMPQKDGLKFLKELREKKSNIPFILFTGKGREEIAIQALNLGAQGYHNKQGSPETIYGELAHTIRLCVEHNEDKQNLIKSETKYSYLFSNMLNGFAHCKMIYDKENNPIDFEYIEVNDAFIKLTGLKRENVIGKKVTEAIPGIEKTNPELIEIYGRVALTGKEEQFEIFFNPIKLWLSVTAYSPEKGYFIALFENVSERKNAQEKLGRTLEVLEKVGEGIDAGLAVIGKDYHVVWANKRLMALGVTNTKKCHQIFNHSETICSDCGARKIFEQNIPLDVHEFKTINSKGETIWIELRVTPLKDKDGNVTAALELAVPINERKKTEEALLWNEEKFRRAFETSPDPCYIGTLEEGIILEVNEAFLHVWGYTKDECLGKTSLQLGLYANGLPDRQRMLSELKSKGHFSNLEFDGRRKGGEVFPLLFSGSVLEIKSKKFIYGILKDITENKKAEQKNKEEEILRNTLLDNLPCTALILEKKTRKIVASNKIAREAGATPGEICYKKYANRNLPCPFCLAPKLWATNETQSLEVEVEGKFYRGIWMPYNEELYVHYIFDITEYKKTEAELLLSEEKFRNVFAIAPNAVYLSTLKEGRLIEVNERFEQIFGYTRPEIIGKTSIQLGLWANPAERENMLSILRSKGKAKNLEINCVKKNGQIFPTQLSVSVLKQGDQQLLVGIIRDFSKYKQAEEALRASEAKYRCLADSLPEVVFETDINGKLTYVNQSAFAIFGYSQEDFTKGLIAFNLIETKDQTKAKENFIKALSNEHIDDPEYICVKKDGSTFPTIIVANTIIAENKPVGLRGLVIDITQLKQAEKTLRASEEKYRVTFESTGTAIVIIEEDAKLSLVNSEFEKLSGYSKEALEGKKFWTEFVVNEDLDRMREQHRLRRIDEKSASNRYEFRFKDRYGTIKNILLTIAMIPETKKSVASLMDITESKIVEEKLKQAAKDFQLLNEKLRVVGGLTRHDISNKLAAIGGNEFLLRKRLANQPALTRYLDGIKTAIEASDKLFEFSRFYEKIGAEKPSVMDVSECFNVAAALFSNLKQIKIVNECQGLRVWADSLLMQIFYNLIDNSIKHGEKVTRIRLHHKIDNESIMLFYEDNGVGILQANKLSIFKVGFSTGIGSGLGLALIKRMIEVYGWTITEEGIPGRGAKFIITIPKSDNIRKENCQI